MSNMTFKLRFIPSTIDSPYEHQCEELDITENILDFSIDPLQLVDKDTLMIGERKATIKLANMKSVFDAIAFPLEEIVETTYFNYGSNSIEYDLSHDGETTTDRIISFLVPFFNVFTNNQNYLDGRMMFPVSYNPGGDETTEIETSGGFWGGLFGNNTSITHNVTSPTIHFVPVRQWYEDPYNSYVDEYIIDKPFYYSVILDIYENQVHLFRGLCVISGYQYSYNNSQLSLEFTDANGIIIRLLDKMGNIQTYFQNVFNSGIMLADLGTILHDMFNSIYPQIKNLFTIPRKESITGIMNIDYQYELGSHGDSHENLPIEAPTIHKIHIQDTGSNMFNFPDIVLDLQPILTKYRMLQSEGTTSLMPYNPEFLIVVISNKESTSFSITSIEGFNYQSEYVIKGYIFNIVINPLYGTIDFVLNEINNHFTDEGDYENYYQNVTSNCAEILISEFDYYNLLIGPSDDILLRTIFSCGTQINFSLEEQKQSDMTKSESIEDVFALCNDEGFNINPDTKDAVKVFLLANLLTIHTVGKNMMFRPFAYSTSVTQIIDSYFIKDISEKKEYYERPNLDAIESVTDWFYKQIKYKIEKLIQFIEEELVTIYNISIASYLYNVPIDVGSVVRFSNFEHSDVEYIDVLVTSINYEKDEVRIEGYGV